MTPGDRVIIPWVTVPVMVQLVLARQAGVIVADPDANLHGQLLMVQLDPLPEAFRALRQIGMVDTLDERVLLFPDEVVTA